MGWMLFVFVLILFCTTAYILATLIKFQYEIKNFIYVQSVIFTFLCTDLSTFTLGGRDNM